MQVRTHSEQTRLSAVRLPSSRIDQGHIERDCEHIGLDATFEDGASSESARNFDSGQSRICVGKHGVASDHIETIN